jgi:hypothetical protein
VVDLRADQVRGQQVRRELDPAKRPAERLGQGLHGQRLGEAGDALEQHVPVGQQPDQEPVQQGLLADQDPLHFAGDVLQEAALLGDRGLDGRYIGHGGSSWSESGTKRTGQDSENEKE